MDLPRAATGETHRSPGLCGNSPPCRTAETREMDLPTSDRRDHRSPPDLNRQGAETPSPEDWIRAQALDRSPSLAPLRLGGDLRRSAARSNDRDATRSIRFSELGVSGVSAI